METMIVVIIMSLMIALFTALPIAVASGWNPVADRRERKRKEAESDLPLYERLARAEEREGEECLNRGMPSNARLHFREAQKIRREATDAMMRGEEPKL